MPRTVISCTGRTEYPVSLALASNVPEAKLNSLNSLHATQRITALTRLLSSLQTGSIPTAPRAAQGHVWGFWVVNSSRPLIREKAERMAPEQIRAAQRGGLENRVTPPGLAPRSFGQDPSWSERAENGAAITNSGSPQPMANANTLPHGHPDAVGPSGIPLHCLGPAP